MSHPVVRALLAPSLSVSLLVVGSGAVIFGFHLLAMAIGAFEERAHGQIPIAIYYRVIVLKGLLPQLLLTLALHPLARRARVRWATPATRPEAVAPSRLALLRELFVVSALAYCAVAPFLLTVDYSSAPALQMTTAGQQITTFVLMTGLTGLAAWLPRLRPGSRQFDRLPGPS